MKQEEKEKQKEATKLKLAEFYKQLSISRKDAKQSKSMDWVFANSEDNLWKLIEEIDFMNKKIADVGGADGKFIKELACKTVIYGSEIDIIDISPEYLFLAKNRLDHRAKEGQFKVNTICSDVNDIDKIKEIQGKYDIIFFRSILEHLYYPDEALDNLHKALKPNGMLIIVTPNSQRLNEKLKAIFPSLKKKLTSDISETAKLEQKFGLKEHIHEYSWKELETILQRRGFLINYVSFSKIPVIAPSLCDKYGLIFAIQKICFGFLELIGLRKAFCFDFAVIAKKTNDQNSSWSIPRPNAIQNDDDDMFLTTFSYLS